jgi:DNA repair exonuclease SbcCD ATPase subunit
MAINLTPNSTADDIPGVVEIIKLLSDSEAYTARLAELRGLAASADSKMADAKAMADKYAAATTMVADATKLLNEHKRRNDELSERTNTVNARERDLAKAASEHGNHVSAATAAHDSREQALNVRENEADSKAAELAALEQSLNRREAAIAARETKMKEIARSFAE